MVKVDQHAVSDAEPCSPFHRMTFLPIVERELRVAAGRKSTYRLRMLSTLLVTGVSGVFLLLSSFDRTTRLGVPLFYALSIYALFVCVFAGVFTTADCLSEEKREGTLGLLFLTDLKGYDIVLGKFFARGLNAFYGLIAIFPVMAIPLLLGGVTGGEFWRASFALVNALFFSLSLGMLVSVLARDDRRAMGNTFFLLLLLNVVIPLASVIGAWVGVVGIAEIVGWLSPAKTFFAAYEINYSAPASGYWLGLLVTQTLGWTFLVLAAWLLPRVWQDIPVLARQPSLARHDLFSKPKAVTALIRRRADWLETNPVLWLAAGHTGINWFAWVIVALASAITLLFLWFDLSPTVFVIPQFLLWPFPLFLKILVAVQVCRFFVEARRSGALELLLCTPLTTREILRGQWLALRRTFLWPAIILALLLPLPRLQLFGSMGLQGGFGPELIGVVFFWGIQLFQLAYDLVLFAFDLAALGWLGMWLGLTSKKPQYAAGLTLFFVVFLPLVFCFVPKIAVDLFCIFWSRDNLYKQLRDRVARLTFPLPALLPLPPVIPDPNLPPFIRPS